MNFSRHLVTFLFLAAALFCYTLALPAGGMLLLICGLSLELIFWYRLSRSLRQRQSVSKADHS